MNSTNESRADKMIKERGFNIIAKTDTMYMYDNVEANRKVIIEKQEKPNIGYTIYSRPILEDTNYLGYSYSVPMGLVMEDMEAFGKKVRELMLANILNNTDVDSEMITYQGDPEGFSYSVLSTSNNSSIGVRYNNSINHYEILMAVKGNSYMTKIITDDEVMNYD